MRFHLKYTTEFDQVQVSSGDVDIDHYAKTCHVDKTFFEVWYKNVLLHSMEVIRDRTDYRIVTRSKENTIYPNFAIKYFAQRCYGIIKVPKWPIWYGIIWENKICFNQYDLVMYMTEHILDHIPGLLLIIESYLDTKYMSYFEMKGKLNCGNANISKICYEFLEYKKYLNDSYKY